ncbi:MAG: pseudouridine synthase, partial [Clostridia bacterium]|nr:pseudouridine synthase [Clostridia bacterium]
MEKKPERLQKLISRCGGASRRKAEGLILEGRVKVNGATAKLGDSAILGRDAVTLDGELLHAPREKLYIALNKPRGYVTTLHDELGRRCVPGLLGDIEGRVYPVGRLDRESEGLLLLTDDGDFANAISHPKNHIAKIYRISVRPAVTEQ